MILTAMNEQALEDPTKLEQKTEHIPMRRAGTPEEIAALEEPYAPHPVLGFS